MNEMSKERNILKMSIEYLLLDMARIQKVKERLGKKHTRCGEGKVKEKDCNIRKKS